MIIFQSIKFWQPGSDKWSCNYVAENMSWYIYWHELFCLFAKYRGRMMRNIHNIFSVDFSKRYERYGTKGTEVQHLIALSLTWLKHVHFAPKSIYRDQVMVYGITIWFARRWDCNTPVEIHQFYDCQWINLYKCMLIHYSMVTPYQLNYIPIRSWFILIHFISISAFPPESRTRWAANFPSIWY